MPKEFRKVDKKKGNKKLLIIIIVVLVALGISIGGVLLFFAPKTPATLIIEEPKTEKPVQEKPKVETPKEQVSLTEPKATSTNS